MQNQPKPFLFGNNVRRKAGNIRKTDLTKERNQSLLPIKCQEEELVLTRESFFESPIKIWINTYNRPQSLKNLLQDIYETKSKFKIRIFILDDCSTEDYTDMLQKFVGKLDIVYHKMSFNHGKKFYWKLCNYALDRIRKEVSQFRYFIKIDDDCRLVKDFFVKCVNIWETINDQRKICLNFRLDSREGKPVWTGVLPRVYKFQNIPVYLSQWVDMDFFCDEMMLRALDFKIREQPLARWRFNKATSSGVGRDISLRLHNKGYHLYLTTESLVNHDHHDSKMNPEERDKNPLITKPISNLKYGLPL